MLLCKFVPYTKVVDLFIVVLIYNDTNLVVTSRANYYLLIKT